MARNRTAANKARQIWMTKLAPWVMAVREGTDHAARTARRERSRARARARLRSSRVRQRWLLMSGAAIAVVGIAGGMSAAALARNRNSLLDQPDPLAHPNGEAPADPIRTTMEAGREKMSTATRAIRKRVSRPAPADAETPSWDERSEPYPAGASNPPPR